MAPQGQAAAPGPGPGRPREWLSARQFQEHLRTAGPPEMAAYGRGFIAGFFMISVNSFLGIVPFDCLGAFKEKIFLFWAR